ncbi:MAG TPA: hypothetical protein VHX59_21960 [Mycobacteriales bacterium]|jgi:RimJ/RimL family protein N-acetyltransferase|nr:hypothetical protein [Mycobacteriales bacterium]
MTEWLRQIGVTAISAYIHPDHLASQRIAAGIGLAPTADLLDGEVRWTDGPGRIVGALR